MYKAYEIFHGIPPTQGCIANDRTQIQRVTGGYIQYIQ
jgi:hypothetical protein